MSTLLEDFLGFAKKEFGCDISIVESEEADTFETIFGASFLPAPEQSILIDEDMLSSFIFEYTAVTNPRNSIISINNTEEGCTYPENFAISEVNDNMPYAA